MRGEDGWVTFVENNPSYQSKSEGVTWTLIPKYTCTVPTDVCRHECTHNWVRTAGHHNTQSLHYIHQYIRTYVHV